MTFEEFEIDRANWQLRRHDQILPLSRKTFDLLLYLVDHADRVVSKEELLRALWPNSFVEESNLTQHIFLLRKALSKQAPETKIIETVPGRGYRLAVPVVVQADLSLQEQVAADPSSITPDEPHQPPQERRKIPVRLGAAPETGNSQPATAGQTVVNGRSFQQTTFTQYAAWWPLLLLIPAVLLGAVYAARSKNPVSQSISAYQQVTHDGRAKWLGGTDGSRIYFTKKDSDRIEQVSIAGGEETEVPLAIKIPRSGQVSPDRSTLLVISQANGQGPANSLWSVHLVGGSYRPLGSAVSAAWSPDGERIVAASAGGELVVMQNDGSNKHQIASPGGYISSLAWSPDGSTIRFTDDGLLWQILPDGSKLQQLLPAWGKTPTQESGDWSLDEKFYFVADGQIWMLGKGQGPDQAKALHPVQLTSGPMIWNRPVPGLDGKSLFASGRVRRGELVRFEPNSARLEALFGGISAEFVTFSRDSRFVAYVSYPEGRLWRADLTGSNPMQLTGPPFHPKSLCWSPDHSQIAFVDRAGNNVDAIFVLPSDGTGKPTRLMPKDLQAETDPSWSPDGKHIAFATSPNVGASMRSDLRTLDLVSGEVAVIPSSDGLLVPRWSPDGQTLAAMTLDTESLALFDLASRHWRPLKTGHVAFPEWSHDGRWIYYIGWTPDAALMRIRAADGRREVVLSLGQVGYTGTYTLWMGLDPNDHPMLLRDEGTDDIYALTLKNR